MKWLVLVAIPALVLSACSGGGGETNWVSDATPQPVTSAQPSGTTSTPTATIPPVESPTAQASGGNGTGAGTPVAGEPYTAAAVWDALSGDNPDPGLLSKLQQCNPPVSACVTAFMQTAGASDEAIAFYQETGWFLVGFRDLGALGLGRILLPWRANANQQYVAMNGKPPLVSPEDEGSKVAFSDDPEFHPMTDAFTAAGSTPSPVALSIFPADDVYESTASLPSGGTRFVFQYNIVNTCHACGTGYRERVGLDFDSDGTYSGASLVGLCRGSEAEVDVSQVPACPVTSP